MIDDAKRYYAVLGVDPVSSDDDIRAAFRRRAKELHPDSASGNAGDFIRLKKAYDVLSDAAKRAHYDRISRPRRQRAPLPMEWVPPIPRPRRFRLGGMSLARFTAAFVFMAGLSFGAIEVILAESDVPQAMLLGFGSHPTPVVRADPAAARKSFAGPTLLDPTAHETPAREPGETAFEFDARIQRAWRPDDQGLAARPTQ